MREILFRGKRLDTGAWTYGYVDATMYKDIVVIHTDNGTHQVDINTVGQYTGLQDMNGNRIFEGDIIKYYKPIDLSRGLMQPSEWSIKEIIDEVVFDDGCFCSKEDKEILLAYLTEDYRIVNPRPIIEEYSLINPNKYPFLHDTNDLYFVEVIGCIHDNQELLKEDNQ